MLKTTATAFATFLGPTSLHTDSPLQKMPTIVKNLFPPSTPDLPTTASVAVLVVAVIAMVFCYMSPLRLTTILIAVLADAEETYMETHGLGTLLAAETDALYIHALILGPSVSLQLKVSDIIEETLHNSLSWRASMRRFPPGSYIYPTSVHPRGAGRLRRASRLVSEVYPTDVEGISAAHREQFESAGYYFSTRGAARAVASIGAGLDIEPLKKGAGFDSSYPYLKKMLPAVAVQQKLNEEAEEKEKVVVVKDGPVDNPKARKASWQERPPTMSINSKFCKSIDIPTADIKKFADPSHWLTHSLPSQYDFLLTLCRKTTPRSARGLTGLLVVAYCGTMDSRICQRHMNFVNQRTIPPALSSFVNPRYKTNTRVSD
ncbi:hypothetical protein B0H14DRAFT_3670218 [Mycena olivaceomarginata]|nr:hypothetical protein B0H14DRAFT_3670218 [Mycena olivaceomarginata]